MVKKTVSSPLVVVVSGGGPVGLTFSLNLAMMMCKKHVKIIIYEDRWFVDGDGLTRWRNEEQGNIRRDQVVTLQDHVIQQMPIYVQKGLFSKINERVWPTSRNLPIQEVEDRLLDLIQPFVQSGQVELIAEQLNEFSECLIKGSFDILVGADGSNSFVRRYCNIQVMSEGIEYACGVAYNIPDNVPPRDEPLHQALNCILTVSQTRYLVNSSASRRGYLNVRLIQSEYEELRPCLEMFKHSNQSLDLLDYNQCPETPVWSMIRQGLDFFNIRHKFVSRIVPIEINVRHASIFVRELRFEIKKTPETITSSTMEKTKDDNHREYKTMLACLVGDAAMEVHFWPGRGMNTGMKSAMALARNIVRSCSINMPPKFLDLLDYEGFMARLRAREQQGRSLRILVDPIDQSVEEAYTYAHLNHCLIRYTTKLKKKLRKTRENLQQRPEWPHQSRPVTDKELDDICKRISGDAVVQISLANPWPTREMSGAEVLVEDTFPFSQQQFLPVPRVRKIISSREPTDHSHHRHHRSLILWIVGDIMSENTKKLIKSIRTSLKSADSSSVTKETTNHSPIPPDQAHHQLHVVNTIQEAKEWMRIEENQENIRRKNTRFKVVTAWSLNEKQTAVDVIRAIRAKIAHVSVLIIPNKHEDTRLAREFPNVTTMETTFDLYEFSEINQLTQCNGYCRVSHSKKEASKTRTNPGPHLNDKSK